MSSKPASGNPLLIITTFVVLGVPLVFLLWDFINVALTGTATLNEALIAIPVLVVFLILLRFLASAVRGLSETDHE